MIAARSRLLPIGLVVMLIVAGFSALVPVASAAQPTKTITDIRLAVRDAAGDTYVNAGEKVVARIGTTVGVEVDARVTVASGSCGDDTQLRETPTMSITVDWLPFGGSDGVSADIFTRSSPFTGNSVDGDYLITGYANFTVAEPGNPANAVDGAARGVLVHVSASCTDVGTLPDTTALDGSSGDFGRSFFVDNKRPTLTLSLAPAGGGATAKVGDAVQVSYSDVSEGIASGTYALSQVRSTNTNPSFGTTLTAFPLEPTGFEQPMVWLNVTDMQGNTGTTFATNAGVDAAVPPAASIGTPTAKHGPGIVVSPVGAASDAASIQVNLTKPDGASTTIVCPKTGTPTGCSFQDGATALTFPSFNITAANLVSNRSHHLSVRVVDDSGNVGPWSQGVSVTTLHEPRGLLTLGFDSGVGGIGTVLNLTWNASTARDVGNVTFIAPNLTASPVRLANDSARPWFNYVVERTDKEGATIDVILSSEDDEASYRFPVVWHPSLEGANFTVFDTLPPFAIPGSLAARARAGGLVEVDIPAPNTGDIGSFLLNLTCTASSCTSTTPRSVTMTVPADFVQGSTVTFDLGGDNFASDFDKVWEITAAPLDKHNNIGPTSAAVQTFPGNNPLVLLVGDPARAVVASIGAPHVPVVGTYSSSVDIVSLNYSVRSETHWWNGGDGAQAASWSTERGADTYFEGNRTGSLVAGTWRANLSCVDGNNPCGTVLPNGTLPSGKYTIVATMKNIEGTILDATKEIWLDKAAPTRNVAAITTPLHFQQGTGPVKLNVKYTDDGPSGLAEVSFQLINASDSGVAYDVNNTPVPAVVCPSAACVSDPITGSLFDSTVEFGLPLVALKDYKLRVTATDGAGNTATAFDTDIISLRPRLALGNATHSAFATASGLSAYLYAAYDGLNTVQPAGACADLACRVTQVELYGRNRTAPAGGAATGDGVVLATYNVPLPQRVRLGDGGTGPLYYNYSPTGLLTDLKGLNREDMYVRGVAKVTVPGSATQVVNMTPWIRVGTDALPSGLAVHRPANSTTVFMSGAVGTVNLNVTYDRVVETPPVINYTVKVLHDRADATRVGKFVRVDTASSPTCGAEVNPPFVTITGRKLGDAQHDFNFTNACRLPAGEYLLDATVRESVGGPAILSTTRFFAVESASPSVTNVAEGTQIYRDGYTRQQFKMQLLVEHGYANLSADGVVLTLDAFGASGFRTLHKGGAEGFDYTIHNVTQVAANQSSLVNLTVTLPTAAAHDSRYDLRVNATTGSFWTEGALTGGVPAKVTRVSSIIVDARAPTAQTTASASNATGSPRTSELRISGTARDSGAGVAAVEVRIINLNLSQTFVWDGSERGSWVGGVLDSGRAWLTSDLVRPSGASTDYARNVHVAPTSDPTLVAWVVNDTNRVRHFESGAVNATSVFAPIGLDRNHTYQVDVRARDLLGSTGAMQTSFISFDVQAPTVGTPTPVGDAADSEVFWHGTGGIDVSVTEDNCVARVTLVGIRPDGENATPVDFARPAGAICTASAGNGAHTWTLDLSQHTVTTHLVGAYDYRVEVEDSAGKVVRSSQNITLVVVDNVQAKVRHLYLEPPTVGANTRSRIVAEIEEFGEIDRVVAIFERLDGTSTTVVAQANMSLLVADSNRVSGNGTHWFVAETDTHLNLTELPVGSYVWTIRPIDVALGCSPSGCHQLSALVRVTADAAPVIQLDSPSANAEWLNRTPTFQWRVFNYNGGLNGLTLLAGNDSENMSETNVTSVSAITTTSGNVTGAVVTYSPTLTEEGNFSVRLRAVSTTGFDNITNVLTFRTDITPPDATSNVTGTVEFNNETYGVPATRITLAANDTLSGVSGITYRINDGSARAYTSSVAVSGDDGDWTLTWTATDVAGNKATGTVELKVDTTGPEVRVAEPGDDMLLVVEDKGVGAVGVNESTVVVYYAYGDALVFSQMEATRETTNSYRVNLGGNASAVGLRYYVVARDAFNNLGTLGSEVDPEEIEKDDQLPPPPPPPENTPPVVVIVKPVAGAQVRGEVIFQWEATDADGDELEVNLALQVPNGPSETLRNGAEASGTLTFNLSRKAAGPYTFVVVASDSEDTTTAQVTFSVLAPQDVTIVTPPPLNAAPGDAVQLAVRVNEQVNPVANVTYVITRDGETYETGPMAKQGDLYTATFVVPDEAGEYESSIEIAYSDGTPSKSIPMGSTTVTASTVGPGPSGGVSIGFIVLLVLGVLTMGLSAGGAFWRWRK